MNVCVGVRRVTKIIKIEMMKSHTQTVLLLSACVVASLISDASSFLSPPHAATATATAAARGPASRRIIAAPLSMAGFGGGGSAPSSKLPKLKAKSQWDRYADLKQCKKVTVGVRIRGDAEGGAAGEWMEVGRVRSEDDGNTEVAVARQRALIAEHSKRLYPVQIPPNAVLEWGYLLSGEKEEEAAGGDGVGVVGDAAWVIVDKSSGENAPAGFEKKIGFEGISDKATGYYCFYNEGRIVERGEAGEKTSLRLQRTASKPDVGSKPASANRGS